ncbi:MAG: DUF1735 domain-containing protein [Prevotella sp.]|jgi:hypothetical protein|nr:DUF1735 domain-containing protein [Prevotella sp.]
MRINSKSILAGMALGALLLTGCNDAEYDTLSNQAYILQTNTNANSSLKLTVGAEVATTTLNVRLSDVANVESRYRLVYDTAVVNEYNRLNETPYASLPQESFSLSSEETTIEAGTSVSTPITLTVPPYSEALKASGKKYAIGFRLENTSGNASVLPSGSKIVYILDQVVIQPVVVLDQSHYVSQNLVKNYPLTEWTVEMNINKHVLYTEVGRGNNQAIFGAGPDEIYIRFGDAPIEGNRLQIKTQGTQMNSLALFNEHTWYHLAFVCTGTKLYLYVNGQLDNSMDLPGKTTNVNSINICSPSTYWLGNAMYSEVRFWQRARSQAEIANNMYACDPTTPGLITYYKMNEGEGYSFRDASGNGNNAETNGQAVPEWIQDVRIDGK